MWMYGEFTKKNNYIFYSKSANYIEKNGIVVEKIELTKTFYDRML